MTSEDLWIADVQETERLYQDGTMDAADFRSRMRYLGFDNREIDEWLAEIDAGREGFYAAL